MSKKQNKVDTYNGFKVQSSFLKMR